MKNLSKDTPLFLLKFLVGLFFFALLALVLRQCQSFSSVEKSRGGLFSELNNPQIDSILARMSTDEKLAQLIMVNTEIHSRTQADSLLPFLKTDNFGGILLSCDSLAQLTYFRRNLENNSKIEVFFGLKSKTFFPAFAETPKFPSQLAFSAVSDDSLRLKYLSKSAEMLKFLNIRILIPTVFSHVGDSVQISDYQKFISNSSHFFFDKNIILGLEKSSFFSNDSVGFSLNKFMMNSDLPAIFSGKPSREIFNFEANLRSTFNFKNLWIVNLQKSDIQTDTISKLLISGADMLQTHNPTDVLIVVKKALADNKLNINLIDNKLRRILSAKLRLGLDSVSHDVLPDSVLLDTLNSAENQVLRQKLFSASLVLLKNDSEILPVKSLKNKSINLVVVGNSALPEFSSRLNTFLSVSSQIVSPSKLKSFKFPSKNSELIIAFNDFAPDSVLVSQLNKLGQTNKLIIINFGEPNHIENITSAKVILQVFGTSNAEQNAAADAIFGAISVNGKLPVSVGKSYTYGVSKKSEKSRLRYAIPEEAGLDSKKLEKIDSIMSNAIASGAFPGGQVFVAKNGLIVYEKSFGAQTYGGQSVRNSDIYDLASVTKIAATTTAAMRMYDSGKLGLDQNFGKYFKDHSIDYKNIKPDTVLNIDTLFYKDITDFKKILKYQDTIRINDSMFMAYDTLIFTVTPKRNIFNSVTIRDLLMHQSGVQPAMPILPYLLYKKYAYDAVKRMPDSSKTSAKAEIQRRYDLYFTNKFIKDSSEVRIADGFYLQNRYFDTLWRDTKRLRVYSRKVYQYTDVNMILVQQAIDSVNQKPLNEYLKDEIYLPLGMFNTDFKAWKSFDRNRIVPSENDEFWRKQLLVGDVHDQSAAMLGGVAGNAGLFSTAHDLGILGQMWLNGGSYGGVRVFSPETVHLFAADNGLNGRGLGFDRATPKSVTGKGVSPNAFGHTGFTGTCIWVDPENDLVYVFISNRVHPSAKNQRINGMKIRQKVHTAIYEAMIQ